MPPRPSSGELWGIHLMPPRYDTLGRIADYILTFCEKNATCWVCTVMTAVTAGFWWTASCPMGWFWPWNVSVRQHSSPSNMSCLRRQGNIPSITSCRRRHPTFLSVLHRWETLASVSACWCKCIANVQIMQYWKIDDTSLWLAWFFSFNLEEGHQLS